MEDSFIFYIIIIKIQTTSLLNFFTVCFAYLCYMWLLFFIARLLLWDNLKYTQFYAVLPMGNIEVIHLISKAKNQKYLNWRKEKQVEQETWREKWRRPRKRRRTRRNIRRSWGGGGGGKNKIFCLVRRNPVEKKIFLNLWCGLGCVCLFGCVHVVYMRAHTHVPNAVLCGWRCWARWNKLFSNKRCSFRLNIHLTLAPLSLFIAAIKKTPLTLKDLTLWSI